MSEKVNGMEIIEIEGYEYYTFPDDYYESENDAAADGYYWNDEVGRWVKLIVNDATTIF